MKKFLLLTAAVLGFSMAYADDYDLSWNFSDDDFTAYVGDIKANTTINGLTITASSDKKVTIDTSSKTVEEVSYTYRLKTGGSGDGLSSETHLRTLEFAVTGPCTIYAVLTSASSSEDRTANVATLNEDGTVNTESLVGTLAASSSGVNLNSVAYEGSDAATIAIYSANSGINFYAIYVKYTGTTAISPVATSAEVVSVEYVNIAGTVSAEPFKGVNIVRTLMSDGTVKTSKIVK